MNIAKLIIGIIFACLLAVKLQAQENKLNIGVETGPGITLLHGNEVLSNPDYMPRLGYAVGVSAQYNFRYFFSIKTGLYYELKGEKIKGHYTDVNGTNIGTIYSHLNFNYLIIPVLAKVSFGKRTKLFIEGGPYVGFLFREGEEEDAWGNYPKTIYILTPEFKLEDVGLSVGAGVEIPIKQRFGITIEARNNIGLLNTADKPVYHNGTIQTFSTNFLVGFEYKLGFREKAAK